ncbi:TonB-dependent siderophore receptor [Yersinia pseudotuberculosis]|uniref:Ferric aerobactin receptor n=8 Tax=Yersinia pseudotuberculosis complex TaxID=1649845 RepID=A0A0H3B0A1_YERPY|nr:TonB-dependent siderophore receptor [Yersinia pseudotuberculosis]AJJ57411.1 TonB-dependent siderophore receptor family protein [Yersinia pseudotuberculosis YPIII]AYW86857.1 TonB-dependent siderophore receptor [Yersinia pseudotuberculosis]AYX01496.1 TonB-dependent siderophore receptor [Yersinia pseudotuberculosis]AZA29251.1 TonB-dependent siderophore receptor [Yersinia pseudotuberculosis]MBK1426079.1 TonB-dependent siderophore receptor [Yersinia pseudotuberculosis]
MKHKHLWVLNPCLLVMLTPAAWAEDQLVVSANRSHRSVAEMAQTTWVIEGLELEQQVQGGLEIKDILAQLIPGIDVSSQGRTNYGMNMRGRSIMVMIDGVRLNSSRSDSRQLDSIDPFNIAHIEVISGATSLYGGGSTGGLINIVTKKGQEGKQVELQIGGKTGFNSHNDHDENISAAMSGGTERAFGRFSVSYQRYGGWYDGKGNEVLIDNTQTGLQYSNRLDVMGTGTLNIDENQQLQLTTQYFNSESDGKHGLYLGQNFSAVTGTGQASNSAALNSDRIPGTERHLINLQYSNTDFWGQDLVAQVYYRDESLTFYPFPTLKDGKVSTIGASQQKTDFYGSKLTLNSEPIDSLTLTYGIDLEHESFNANQQFFNLAKAQQSGGMTLENAYNVGRYPSYTTTNLAPFLQTRYDINPIFTLSGGVRYQYTENKVDDFVGYAQQQAIASGSATSADPVPGGKTDYNNFLFNAGLLAHLTESQQTWFNFSQGFEIPDLAKYYGSGSYTLVNGHYQLQNSVNVNDSKLEGIKVDSYELGWRYTGDNLRTQMAGYYSLSDQTISINKTDMTINVLPDKRRIYGVEGAVDYFFDNSEWSAGATFNLIKSETKVSGKWQKLTIDAASPSKATAYIGWAPGDWNLRVQSQQTFDVSDSKGDKIDGYNTIDFLSSYALPVGKLSFSIENLLDKEYTTVWGQRAPILYSPTYGSPNLYSYKGRGRTFGVNYSVLF